MKAAILTLLAVAVSSGSAARILALFYATSRSHKQLYQPLMEELASRGHHVTIVSPFDETTSANLTAIKIERDISGWLGGKGTPADMISRFSHPNSFLRALYMFDITHFGVDMALKSPDVARLIRSEDQQFELVFVLSVGSEALLAFGRRFGASIIAICPTVGASWTEDEMGNELNPSYVPNTFLSFSDHMTFRERLSNLLFSAWTKLLLRVHSAPNHDAIMRRHFPDVELPPVLDLYSDVSMYFVNILPGVNYPRPLAPNTVPIGGLHILPTRPLPQDMKKFLDESREGAILFSLGTNMRSADLSKEKREIIVNVFSKLKQRVMWKFEKDDLEGLPGNVRIWKWLPQNDILGCGVKLYQSPPVGMLKYSVAGKHVNQTWMKCVDAVANTAGCFSISHPKLRAFITHGGLLSSQEAIYHGVPVLLMPIFADQELNAEQAQRAGMGITLHLSTLTEDSFEKALGEIIQNPRYREKAAHMSNIFRDQPESPLERAVFWTEYVLRHKGAAHLRPASVELAWYQLYLLDVVGVLLFVLAAAMCFVILLCRRLLCGASKSSVSLGKKKTE